MVEYSVLNTKTVVRLKVNEIGKLLLVVSNHFRILQIIKEAYS